MVVAFVAVAAVLRVAPPGSDREAHAGPGVLGLLLASRTREAAVGLCPCVE